MRVMMANIKIVTVRMLGEEEEEINKKWKAVSLYEKD